ncbi:hypothetical protein ACVMHR_008913 [Bradyrhizobium diazoefficiens]
MSGAKYLAVRRDGMVGQNSARTARAYAGGRKKPRAKRGRFAYRNPRQDTQLKA